MGMSDKVPQAELRPWRPIVFGWCWRESGGFWVGGGGKGRGVFRYRSLNLFYTTTNTFTKKSRTK